MNEQSSNDRLTVQPDETLIERLQQIATHIENHLTAVSKDQSGLLWLCENVSSLWGWQYISEQSIELLNYYLHFFQSADSNNPVDKASLNSFYIVLTELSQEINQVFRQKLSAIFNEFKPLLEEFPLFTEILRYLEVEPSIDKLKRIEKLALLLEGFTSDEKIAHFNKFSKLNDIFVASEELQTSTDDSEYNRLFDLNYWRSISRSTGVAQTAVQSGEEDDEAKDRRGATSNYPREGVFFSTTSQVITDEGSSMDGDDFFEVVSQETETPLFDSGYSNTTDKKSSIDLLSILAMPRVYASGIALFLSEKLQDKQSTLLCDEQSFSIMVNFCHHLESLYSRLTTEPEEVFDKISSIEKIDYKLLRENDLLGELERLVSETFQSNISVPSTQMSQDLPDSVELPVDQEPQKEPRELLLARLEGLESKGLDIAQKLIIKILGQPPAVTAESDDLATSVQQFCDYAEALYSKIEQNPNDEAVCSDIIKLEEIDLEEKVGDDDKLLIVFLREIIKDTSKNQLDDSAVNMMTDSSCSGAEETGGERTISDNSPASQLNTHGIFAQGEASESCKKKTSSKEPSMSM